MSYMTFRGRERSGYRMMVFLIERSFRRLVVDSENEFRRSLILRWCISEQLLHNLFQMNTICTERSNIFLRIWNHFSRCTVDLQNNANYLAIDDVSWKGLKRKHNWTLWKSESNIWSIFLFLCFYNSNEWLWLWCNTSQRVNRLTFICSSFGEK